MLCRWLPCKYQREALAIDKRRIFYSNFFGQTTNCMSSIWVLKTRILASRFCIQAPVKSKASFCCLEKIRRKLANFISWPWFCLVTLLHQGNKVIGKKNWRCMSSCWINYKQPIASTMNSQYIYLSCSVSVYNLLTFLFQGRFVDSPMIEGDFVAQP